MMPCTVNGLVKKHTAQKGEVECVLNRCFHWDFADSPSTVFMFLYHLWGNYMLPVTTKFSGAVVIHKVVIRLFFSSSLL